MPEQPADFIAVLEDAAVAAIRSQRRSLTVDPGQLRSVLVEIALRPGTQAVPIVTQTDCFTQRRVRLADCIGVRG